MAKVELKAPVVQEIAAKIDGAQSAVLVDHRGMTVAQDTELRKRLREAGVEYKVYKNTMMKRAFEGTDFAALDEYLEGPSALAVSKEDATAPARILYEFAKEDGRNKWGISQDDRVIFCGATYITTERKGFQYLYKSLEHLKTLTDVSNVTVLAAGTDSAKLQLPSGYQVKRVGKLSFEDLFRAYFCSDLFVCPSLEDSGPMMINYSVASCIPVVCYKMGIADDIVRHKENGYIASWGDWKDFAEGILYCLENPMPKQELKILANEIMEDLKEHRSIRKYLGLPS